MNQIFKPHLRKFELVFYDILVSNKTWEMHLHHVRAIVTMLQRTQLLVKRMKNAFGGS